MNHKLLILGTGAFALGGCSLNFTPDESDKEQLAQQLTPAQQVNVATSPAVTATQVVQIAAHSAMANQLFDDIYKENLMASPIRQTYMGIKQDYDKWDDISDSTAQANHLKDINDLNRLKKLNPELLDEQTKLSFYLFENKLKDAINDHQWRFHTYPVSQMRGLHSQAVSMLINAHKIESVSDAQAYIARLHGLKKLMKQLTQNLRDREERGIMAPHFVYAYVINDSMNVLTGKPFNSKGVSPLYADFSRKVDKLPLSDNEKETLKYQARDALVSDVKSGYSTLISYLREQQARASYDDGAWKFPDGDLFYKRALENTTTTDLTAKEIHEIGLSEVARIHEEMREIMRKVKFQGDLNQFFEFMRTDKQFYYPNTDEGRQAYLTKATDYIDQMKGRLDELFIVKPKAELVVKTVEPFREKSAGKAFYNRPSPDGTRPGRYYANLYDMNNMPKYQMEALAFHEGVPGHHMQLSLGMELTGIPDFRKYGHYTAYSEGWGLYSELLPKEIGFYQDPYSDFGRLAMELWRACRLVVDTGIHQMRWTREQAIDYLVQNTPNPKGDVVKAIERYIVMPSQATAYKIGMIKIVELRQKAKDRLGAKFSIRDFHHAILRNGPVPLDVLEQQVDNYINQTM
ncbi:MAG: DUF885 domain-containing protein [Psychrobium sp.]